jgi:quinol monooxygenase YgiN
MPLRTIVHIQAAPGRGAELVEDVRPLASQMLEQPGCLQWDVYANVHDPDKVLLVQTWTDRALFEAHLSVTPPTPPPEILAFYSPEPIVYEAYEHTSTPYYWPHERGASA